MCFGTSFCFGSDSKHPPAQLIPALVRGQTSLVLPSMCIYFCEELFARRKLRAQEPIVSGSETPLGNGLSVGRSPCVQHVGRELLARHTRVRGKPPAQNCDVTPRFAPHAYRGIFSGDAERCGSCCSVGCDVELVRETLPPEFRRALTLEVCNLPRTGVFLALFRRDGVSEPHEVGFVASPRIVGDRQLVARNGFGAKGGGWTQVQQLMFLGSLLLHDAYPVQGFECNRRELPSSGRCWRTQRWRRYEEKQRIADPE